MGAGANRRIIYVCLVLATLGACRKEFARPAPEKLVLGQVTRPEILLAYGKPVWERTNVVGAPATRAPSEPGSASGTFRTLSYHYRDPAEVFLQGASAGEKTIVFEFVNDRLFAYNFVSSFHSDSSNFDESNVVQLENGRTTREDVEALFGPPGGRAVFPATALAVGEEKWIYQYAVGVGSERERKRLDLVFTNDGKLRDFRFVSRSGFVPSTGHGVAAPVPIIIPAR
jgi:hypothetical protein